MNASILAPSEIVSKAMCTETVNRTPFWDGFYAYCEMQALEDMPTKEHERGWWAALSAEAGSSMPYGLSAKDLEEYTDEYESYIEDVEFWRKGC